MVKSGLGSSLIRDTLIMIMVLVMVIINTWSDVSFLMRCPMV
jgi:hypothetical protein